METIKPKDCKINSTDSWIIGGATLLGLGAGFFVLQTSAMAFVGCLMVGIGLGLVISSIVAKNNTEKQ